MGLCVDKLMVMILKEGKASKLIIPDDTGERMDYLTKVCVYEVEVGEEEEDEKSDEKIWDWEKLEYVEDAKDAKESITKDGEIKGYSSMEIEKCDDKSVKEMIVDLDKNVKEMIIDSKHAAADNDEEQRIFFDFALKYDRGKRNNEDWKKLRRRMLVGNVITLMRCPPLL
jgi:hypothetical protein